jgi:hypothetical protein
MTAIWSLEDSAGAAEVLAVAVQLVVVAEEVIPGGQEGISDKTVPIAAVVEAARMTAGPIGSISDTTQATAA